MQKLLTPETIRNWAILIIVVSLITVILATIGLPAAYLLGPMIGGLILSAKGMHFKVSKLAAAFCQGVIGMMIAQGIPISFISEAAKEGPLFAFLILGVILLSFTLGWILASRQILPGSTAIWGSSPGAASAMVIMAEAAGADHRLVAFMQYLRVLMVAGTASLIAHFALSISHELPPPRPWFEPFPAIDFIATLAIAATGPILGIVLKRPTLNLVAPMALGVALHAVGLIDITLPKWFLAAAYIVFGLSIGLRFTREIVAHALKALPALFASVFTLILSCGALAVALSYFANIDLLTAYLATSPGGADSVAIIVASSPVDKPFVLTMQVGRFLAVLFLAPILSKFAVRQFEIRTGRKTVP